MWEQEQRHRRRRRRRHDDEEEEEENNNSGGEGRVGASLHPGEDGRRPEDGEREEEDMDQESDEFEQSDDSGREEDEEVEEDEEGEEGLHTPSLRTSVSDPNDNTDHLSGRQNQISSSSHQTHPQTQSPNCLEEKQQSWTEVSL
ncbi:zinc finger and BTB domain-containing protein 47-like [Electrophorus electricus]|uniref:zinc finger and BTB domain-containing protein 47-like n=1 Tax=Electrophorus electricus TaxID=8005 RepID=UPI000F09EEFD|nr:zinc finger and BTB domain-containing protein 47-like [Electrophorus electricus]